MSGELDAVLHPDLIDPILKKDPNVGRLFPDHKAEEIRYYKKTQIFPIMHVMALRREIVERHSWIPVELYKAFEAAKAIGDEADGESAYRSTGLVSRSLGGGGEDLLGRDPWEYRLTDKNRHNLETLVTYSHEQGIDEAQAVPGQAVSQCRAGAPSAAASGSRSIHAQPPT